ncbi:MAG: SdrD B-like domain-containing protein [Pseudomonadota bacterium]
MNLHKIPGWLAGSLLLASYGNAFAVVSGDLLTNSKDTTDWQICTSSENSTDLADTFDPTHLTTAACAYRETPAVAGTTYKLTCGVSSLKYSSLTLAFLTDDGVTLDTKTTEIYEDSQGGAFSVVLEAPTGTTVAAVGIYGLAGTGFQDCTLFVNEPDPGPQSGSIGGLAWFDENADSVADNDESRIPTTPVTLLRDGAEQETTRTDLDGKYYFGELDLDQCYQVRFGTADPTLTFTTQGADSAADTDGLTAESCLSAQAPNITGINAGYVPVPPVAPPVDYAICGSTFLTADGSAVTDTQVQLQTASGETFTTTTDAKGNYAFVSLPAGDYRVYFSAPGGYEFSESSTALTAATSYAGPDGWTPAFNLPANSNTDADDACSIRHVNAGFVITPVALEPTVANDDKASAFVGEQLSVDIISNDMPCDDTVLEVDIITHNVPGNVSYDAASGSVIISDTTQAGSFSIEYGLRGDCGSYDTAVVSITLEEVPPPPPPQAPDAIAHCQASIGKSDRTNSGIHVDLYATGARSKADFATSYNFYDANNRLVYTGQTAAAGVLGANHGFNFGIFFRKREHGIEVFDVVTVRAVENGVESAPTECSRVQVTPIALDTDGSGRVEGIYGKFAFDMDGDGTPEDLLKWFSPDDGILIGGDYHNGVNGTHLFGDTGGQFTDGFAKLALKDRNNDGQLTNDELQGLSIWTDRNSNAQIDHDEVSALQTHNIEALSVEHYKYSARATLGNGKSILMRDVWFPVSPIVQATR